MNFIEWLESNNACSNAMQWVSEQPDNSLPALMQTCPRGNWILWVYEKAGYDFETLSPVVYAAVNRALEYAAQELDESGVKHDLRKHIITDRTTAAVARAAAYADYDYVAVAYTARAAYADAAYAAVYAAAYAAAAADAVADYVAYAAAGVARAAAGVARAAAAVARAAAYAAYAAGADADTEHKKCADDCREFLPPLIIPAVEATQDE